MEIKLKQKLRSMITRGSMVGAEVRQEVNGGYRVNLLSDDLGDVQAFMPYSQSHARGVAFCDLPSFEVNIIEMDSKRESVVVSAKEDIIAWVDEQRDMFFRDLYVGQVIDGKVNNIVDFGVFVDLGKASGLIHVKKLSTREYKKGNSIRVEIESIDVKQHRIGLIPYIRKMTIKERVRSIVGSIKPHGEPSIRFETVEPRKLRELISAMSRDEALAILPKLRKRADWSIKKVLTGNADWYTPYREVTE